MALIISRTFDVDIDKDVVRRVLAEHYRPGPGGDGPSWRAFFGHLMDGLWRLVLHRCKSLMIKGSGKLHVMAQFTRRLIDLGELTDGGDQVMIDRETILVPHLRHGRRNDRLGYTFDRCYANPCIPEVHEPGPFPYLPRSPPSVDRSIQEPRRESNVSISSRLGNGLEPKTAASCDHDKDRLVGVLIGTDTSIVTGGEATRRRLNRLAIRSQTQCHGLYELPVAA